MNSLFLAPISILLLPSPSRSIPKPLPSLFTEEKLQIPPSIETLCVNFPLQLQLDKCFVKLSPLSVLEHTVKLVASGNILQSDPYAQRANTSPPNMGQTPLFLSHKTKHTNMSCDNPLFIQPIQPICPFLMLPSPMPMRQHKHRLMKKSREPICASTLRVLSVSK